MPKVLDEQLVNDYLAGDEKSLEILIKRYLKPIYGFVYRYVGNSQEAEDITQEAFIKAWKNLKKFKKGKNFKTWIFEIAKNTSIDFLRKKKTIPFSRFENEKGQNVLLETLVGPSVSFSENIDSQQYLTGVIKKLSPKNRTAFSYKLYGNLTFDEIARSLGESINTVKSRYRRALIRLKKIIK